MGRYGRRIKRGNRKTMTKILITGGLGYLGRAVCELLKNSDYEITVVDNNNNAPDKFAWCVKNKIQVLIRDIFEIGDLIKNHDVIIHGAGLTDVVPKTKESSNPTIDAEIHRVGTAGSREIFKYLSNNQKLIFYSTHVIFEDISPGVLNINENSKPAPLLAYATSKRQTELDLLDSNLDFTVLRLASVYGYNNCIRHRILPNWFSYLAGQGKNLGVFGAGTNVKPLVCCDDVARAAIFSVENNLKQEIVHVTNENLSVLEIAELCQKFNPSISINHTNDPIINDGYNFYGDKLLKYGFTYESNITDEIENMVRLWGG